MTRALVPLADGVEEMEAVIVIDTLRRAGWEVVAAGVTPSPITASRGVRLLADVSWSEVTPLDFDVLVLPGGAVGTANLMHTETVLEAVRTFQRAGRTLAAICAAPLILQAAGVLNGFQVTCHPGAAGDLTAATRSDARVVVDRNVITSQGPGTALEFALAVLEEEEGRDARERVAPGLILPPGA